MATLKGLSCLPHLSRVEIFSLYAPVWPRDNSRQDNNGGDLALVQDIHQELRKLSEVYIYTLRNWRHDFKIWELVSDVWRSKKVDQNTYQLAVRGEFHAV